MPIFSRDASCGRILQDNAYGRNSSDVVDRKTDVLFTEEATNSKKNFNDQQDVDLKAQVKTVQKWFAEHVTLFGQPYTLDYDQAKAVCDQHKNTIVTARAGSGKTRVIVAKITYLVASKQADLSEIAAFMFNRTAAAEVNERIGAVKVDGRTLPEISIRRLRHSQPDEYSADVSIADRFSQSDIGVSVIADSRNELSGSQSINVASTFHKYALDLLKISGLRPQILGEQEHDQLVLKTITQVLHEQAVHLSPKDRIEMIQLINSFIARAGQRYFGEHGLAELEQTIQDYCVPLSGDPNYAKSLQLHWLSFLSYQQYLQFLQPPLMDFNILMSKAIQLLNDNMQNVTTTSDFNPAQLRVAPLKFLLVDEYQDFSYLFFSIIQAMRQIVPDARLFVVGDDWQAINRFAGSDVNYFINFAEYFPENVINIPLMTNYRSDQRIVENANRYMLLHYNPEADKAIAFSCKNGKIFRCNPRKVKFDTTDLTEDGLGDAKFQKVLAGISGGHPQQYTAAAQYLKSVYRIIQKNRQEQIMLLHRHNFTSFAGISLAQFALALRALLIQENIMTTEDFTRKIRIMTMHKSKGLEADVVILLECDRKIVLSHHPHATTFPLFGDTLEAEQADQHRLLYVALTRARHKLYLLSSDPKPPC